jgi:hypothetical protein
MKRRELFGRVSAWAATGAVATQFQFGCLDAFAQGDTARLLGTWRLVDIRNDKGEQIRGPKPTGLLFYDGTGNMAVQIMPDWDRPKFALGKTQRTYLIRKSSFLSLVPFISSRIHTGVMPLPVHFRDLSFLD